MLRVVDVRRNASSFSCKLIILPSYTPNIALLSRYIPGVCILQAHTFALFTDAHCEVWFVFLFSQSGVLVVLFLYLFLCTFYSCCFCLYFVFFVFL